MKTVAINEDTQGHFAVSRFKYIIMTLKYRIITLRNHDFAKKESEEGFVTMCFQPRNRLKAD
jgi:hypothetical protein